MGEIRFVQVNHLHPSNDLHLRQFDLRRFDDYPTAAVERTAAARKVATRQALGDAPEEVVRAFILLSGSMIHDLYTMRAVLGLPSAVVSAELWQEGRALTFTLAYPGGARCVATWIDLPDLWDFKETLEIYGDARRVLLSYPTGFARGLLSSLVIQGTDADGTAYRTEPAVDWESAFLRELRHFHECIVDGIEESHPAGIRPRRHRPDHRHHREIPGVNGAPWPREVRDFPRGRDQQGAGGVRPGGRGNCGAGCWPTTRTGRATTSLRRRAGSTTPTVRSTTRARTTSSTSTGRYSPTAARGPVCWGHATSTDLLHWEDWPGGDVARPPLRRGGGLLRQHLHRRRRLPLCAVHRQTWPPMPKPTECWRAAPTAG